MGGASGQTSRAQARILDEINRRYREAVRRYFLKRIGDPAEAEDLTQDLMLRLAAKADLDRIEHTEAFLFTMAANLLRDRGRRRRTAAKMLAELGGARSENFEVLSPERVLSGKEALHNLLKAQEQLDPRVRNVFILHRLEGMKYADIARLYGLSVSAIEKDIIKALAHLARYAAKNPE
jgi:RNA polymerase sigma-70 factor (ECF subfamily)